MRRETLRNTGALASLLLATGCASGGDGCLTGEETGTVSFSIQGTPADASDVTLFVGAVTGRGNGMGFDIDVPLGRHRLDGPAIRGPGWPIPTALAPVFDPDVVCVRRDEITQVSVSWSSVGTSGRLWFPESGFRAYSVSTSDAPIATGETIAGSALAFDLRGDVWTWSEGGIAHFRSSDLASGNAAPDRRFPVPLAASDNFVFAVDPEGNLWVPTSVPGASLMLRYARKDLLEEQEPVPTVIRMTQGIPSAFAFDDESRLWMFEWDGLRAARYDPVTEDLVTVAGPFGYGDYIHPVGMAFDRSGDLWVAHWNESIDRYALAGSAVMAIERHSIGSEARNHTGVAIDDAGVIWTGYVEDHFGGFRMNGSGLVLAFDVPISPEAADGYTSPAIFVPRY